MSKEEAKQKFLKEEVAKLDAMISEMDHKIEDAKNGRENLVMMREVFAGAIDDDQLEFELVD